MKEIIENTAGRQPALGSLSSLCSLCLSFSFGYNTSADVAVHQAGRKMHPFVLEPTGLDSIRLDVTLSALLVV